MVFKDKIKEVFETLENDFHHGKKSFELSNGCHVKEGMIHKNNFGEIWFQAKKDMNNRYGGTLYFKTNTFGEGHIIDFLNFKKHKSQVIDFFIGKAKDFIKENHANLMKIYDDVIGEVKDYLNRH